MPVAIDENNPTFAGIPRRGLSAVRSDNSVKSKDSETSHERDRETKRDTQRGRGLVRDKVAVRSRGKVKDRETVTNKETGEDGDDEAEEDFKPFSEISNSKSGTKALLGCNAMHTLPVIFMILISKELLYCCVDPKH